MQINMRRNNFVVNFALFLFLFINFQTSIFSETMILTGCKTLKDGFLKNEYILDFEKSLMTRNFVYDNKTYKKLKLTDLSIKKDNTIERFFYQDNDLIFIIGLFFSKSNCV